MSIYRGLYTTPNNAYPVFNPDGSLGGSPLYQSANLYGQAILSGYYLYPKTDFNLDVSLEHKFQGALKGLYASGTYSYNSSYREALNRSKNFAVYSYWKDPTDPDSEEIYQQMSSSSSQNNTTSYNRLNRMQYVELAVGYDFAIDKNSFRTKAAYTYNDYMASALNIPMRKNGISFRAEYDYDRRYMAEFAIGAKGLNWLNPGDQWSIAPSVGLGWNMHKESWFKSDIINEMKLRATFGINRNDGTGAYYRSASGVLSNYYYTYLNQFKKTDNGIYFGKTPSGNTMYQQSKLVSVVKPEKITRWNVGLDTKLFNRSLTATVEYFRNTYSDVMGIPVGKNYNHILGITSGNINSNEYRRSGIELDLAYEKQWGDVNFMASGNATFYKSKLLKNGENAYPESYMQAVGDKYGMIRGYVADGFFQSQKEIDEYLATTRISDYTPQPGDLRYCDLNGDGVLDGKDIKAIGTNAPLIEYGLYLSAEWKGVQLSMQWSGLANSQTTTKTMPFETNSQGTYGQALVEHLDYWTPENPNARYPRVTAHSNSYNERTSTFWLQNSSYLRLKNIELSYTLPKTWTNAVRLHGVKVFVNGYNLLTVSPMKDRDPEMKAFYTSSEGLVPNYKAYNVGVNIQF